VEDLGIKRFNKIFLATESEGWVRRKKSLWSDIIISRVLEKY